jgi:hypothetical protein
MELNKEIIAEVLDTGLIVLGAKKAGKSNAAKVLATDIINNYPNIQCRIFDTCQNWLHGFEPIICQKIIEDTRYLYTEDKHVLYDIALMDIDEIMESIGAIAFYDYNRQRLLKSVGQLENKWIVYVIEEAQNILGNYSLMKKSGKLWLKVISEARNFNMAFIMIGQRAADISAKAVERAQGYLFGRAGGDNDKKKIGRIVGNATIKEELRKAKWIRVQGDKIVDIVPKLNLGEFVYFNGNSGRVIQFPEYTTKTVPKILGEKINV